MGGAIDVDWGHVAQLSGQVADVAADLRGLRASGVGGPAQPPLTAAALHELEATLRGSLDQVATSVQDLSAALRTAALRYQRADADAVPGAHP